MTKNPAEAENRVLILTPTGQDSKLVSNLLAASKIDSRICTCLQDLHDELALPWGAVVLAEEALREADLDPLRQALEKQPPWSDIPVIFLTGGGGEANRATLTLLEKLSSSINVTFLERPFRTVTLLSVIRVALRARKRQYEVRRLLEEQLTATMMRDEFISIASHELKTPLTSLKLQLELSKRAAAKSDPNVFAPARVLKLIDSSHEQTIRLAKLIEDMLDISRIGIGKLLIERKQVDLSRLVTGLLERLAPQLSAARCELRLNMTEPVLGHWDAYRLEQVISNLLTNVIRYAPGTPVEITISKVGETAQLVIRDHGPGISKQNQERIFSRFERAVSANNISGLGLGLYICREIVQAHGGTIFVESTMGEGAAFTVTLPIHSESLAATGSE